MRIIADENIPGLTIAALREMGHDVLDVRMTSDRGASDSRIWDLALAQSRLVITTDKGFAGRRRESHYGILVVALRQPNRRRIHEGVLKALTRFQPRQWPGLLVVVRDRTLSHWKARGAR